MFHVITTVLTPDSLHPDVVGQLRMSLSDVDLNMLSEVGLVLAGINQRTEVSDQSKVERLNMIEEIPPPIGGILTLIVITIQFLNFQLLRSNTIVI